MNTVEDGTYDFKNNASAAPARPTPMTATLSVFIWFEDLDSSIWDVSAALRLIVVRITLVVTRHGSGKRWFKSSERY